MILHNKTHREITMPRTTMFHSFLTAALFFSFSTIGICQAATEFNGALKSISITDAARSNIPPVVNFSFIQNSVDSYTFDASASSDSDGNIAKFRWDFGDGTVGEGMNLEHKFQGSPPYTVTLTLIDNAGGVSISQSKIANTPLAWLQDNFSETISIPLQNHAPETGGGWAMLGIKAQIFNNNSGGYAVNANTDGDIAYNSAAPISSDYTVTIIGKNPSTLSDRLFGACVRVQPNKQAYCAYLGGNGVLKIVEYPEGATSIYGTTLASGTYVINTSIDYALSLTVSGASLTATIDGLGTITANDSTIIDAGHAGFVLRRNEPLIRSIEAK